MCIYGIQKNGIDELIQKQKYRHRGGEQTHGYQGGKEWVGKDWEFEMDMYTLLY